MAKKDEIPADISGSQWLLNVFNLQQKVHELEMGLRNMSTAISEYDNTNLRLVQDINRQFSKLEGRIADLEKSVIDAPMLRDLSKEDA